MHSPSRPEGKLAVFLPGMGAVATTFIAGVLLARRGLGRPVGSLTQMGSIRAGSYTERVDAFVPLAALDRLEFAGWDVFPDTAYEAAVHAEVLSDKHLALVRDELDGIVPMKGVFYPEWVRRLSGTHVKSGASKAQMVEELRDDIRRTMRDKRCERGVAVWCGSTEVHHLPGAVHQSMAAFEAGLRRSSPEISNSQLYAWACVLEGVPFVNASPNMAVDFPAIHELALARGVDAGRRRRRREPFAQLGQQRRERRKPHVAEIQRRDDRQGAAEGLDQALIRHRFRRAGRT